MLPPSAREQGDKPALPHLKQVSLIPLFRASPRHFPDRTRPFRARHAHNVRHRHSRLHTVPHRHHRIRFLAKIEHRLAPQLVRTAHPIPFLRALAHGARFQLIRARRAGIIDQHHHSLGVRFERVADRRGCAGAMVVQAADVGELPAGTAHAVVVGDQVGGHGGRGILAGRAAETAGHCFGQALAVSGHGRLHGLPHVRVGGE